MNKMIFRMPEGCLERHPSLVNGHRDLVDQNLFVHTGLGGKPIITVFFRLRCVIFDICNAVFMWAKSKKGLIISGL